VCPGAHIALADWSENFATKVKCRFASRCADQKNHRRVGDATIGSVKPAVISYIVIANGKLLSEVHVRIRNRLRIELPKDETLLIIAAVNRQPHPLALARLFVNDLDLDVVAVLVLAHGFLLIFDLRHAAPL
jgi:hypothetical protein